MADIMRVSSASVSARSQQSSLQKPADPSEVFELDGVNQLTKPSSVNTENADRQQSFSQNTAGSSNILMGLLKDPAVTVSFLRNISMMQELIKLLPANNNPVSAEIEQLFNSLLVAPGDISEEMLMQELNSTQFRGELFDGLRLAFNGGGENIRADILNLLKAVSAHISRGDVLNASANSLQYLGESLAPSSTLSQKLLDLSAKFRAENAFDNFDNLKNEAFALGDEVKKSILFSSKLSKVLSILSYNLSRVNTNKDFLKDAAAQYMQSLSTPEEKEAFLEQLNGFLTKHTQEQAQTNESRIMQVLTKIIGKQAQSEDLMTLNADKIEKIIQSLLSSPCNFTPLLHYVIPVEFMDMKAFAEMWVNPNGGEDERPYNEAKEVTHLLVIFDIENVGRFETEIYAKDKSLDISVLCPPDKLDYFKNISKRISRGIADTGYRVNEVTVDKLVRTRSLMEVFKSLPYKRTGVDVTV